MALSVRKKCLINWKDEEKCSYTCVWGINDDTSPKGRAIKAEFDVRPPENCYKVNKIANGRLHLHEIDVLHQIWPERGKIMLFWEISMTPISWLFRLYTTKSNPHLYNAKLTTFSDELWAIRSIQISETFCPLRYTQIPLIYQIKKRGHVLYKKIKGNRT